MRGNLGNLMQQAQRMQAEMKRAQEELAQLELEGSAGGGAVRVTLSGKHEVRAVRIDPAVIEDRELLEDLLATAFNDAARKVEAAAQQRMGALGAGLGLPPGLKLPF